MDILVGKEYLLNIAEDIRDDVIDYVGRPNSPRFSKWGEVAGKRVKVKNVVRTLADYYEVSLVNDVNHSFYVPKRMLSLVPKLASKCNCSTRQLFLMGCRCGAFKKEFSLQKD